MGAERERGDGGRGGGSERDKETEELNRARTDRRTEGAVTTTPLPPPPPKKKKKKKNSSYLSFHQPSCLPEKCSYLPWIQAGIVNTPTIDGGPWGSCYNESSPTWPGSGCNGTPSTNTSRLFSTPLHPICSAAAVLKKNARKGYLLSRHVEVYGA